MGCPPLSGRDARLCGAPGQCQMLAERCEEGADAVDCRDLEDGGRHRERPRWQTAAGAIWREGHGGGGGHPRGAEGGMLASPCDGRRELPPGTARAYSSYCGNYTFDGTRLVTRVDASSDPARIGGDQGREVSFEGDPMILRPPPPPTEAGEEYLVA